MRVLVAEDDAVYQVMLRGILTRWGYEVTLTSGGEEAWRQLSLPDGPRLAILDWMMPGTDGVEVCRRLRAACLPQYVYVILLTGKTESTSVVAGLEAGADDYLPKPVNLEELRVRLRAGSRVVESEQRYRAIAETASDGILTLTAENRVAFANRAAGAIFALPAAELTGMAFGELAPGFDRIRARLEAAPRPWAPLEIKGLRRDGSERVLEISFSESGDIDRGDVLTALIRDITERKAAERQRAQAQKLESIGHLAAGVAHEINTPVQYIADNVRFLQDAFRQRQTLFECYERLLATCKQGTPPAARIAEIDRQIEAIDPAYLAREVPAAITQAMEGVDRVAAIVAAMKDFSHPGTAKMMPTDLNRVVESAVLLTRNEWKYIAGLELELAPDLPPVVCDSSEVSQVVLNLLMNAADAIADARQGRRGPAGVIAVSTRCCGQSVEIRVRDSGTGIPEAIRSKIFDPFFTTKQVGKGSGQGLALAFTTVVHKHHGKIDFQTEVGAGTTFIVTLPVQGPRQLRSIAESAYSAAQVAPVLSTNSSARCLA